MTGLAQPLDRGTVFQTLLDETTETATSIDGPTRRDAMRIPYIGIQAFCESPEVSDSIRRASADRTMSRANVTLSEGGVTAATARFQKESSPQLIVIESRSEPEEFLAELDRLAETCDIGTKVMAIGHVNDVKFYRELTRRGISEYLLAPLSPEVFISSVSAIYSEPASGKLGQTFAFLGAKGGAGSSTIAHNVGWTIARQTASDVVLADMDLAFGTASLDFKLDPGQGVVEAIEGAGRLDEVLFDRLLAKCDDHFSLLRAPGTLEKCYDLEENSVDPLIEIAQSSVPFLILDMPHVWSSWAKNVIVGADEIVITAIPDLANLRNAKSLITFLRQARPYDPPPKLILNQVGMPKRPEIKAVDFAKAVQLELLAVIPFEPYVFGTAAIEGQMVSEVSAKAQASRAIADVAIQLAAQQPASRKNRFNIGSMIKRMKFGSRAA